MFVWALFACTPEAPPIQVAVPIAGRLPLSTLATEMVGPTEQPELGVISARTGAAFYNAPLVAGSDRFEVDRCGPDGCTTVPVEVEVYGEVVATDDAFQSEPLVTLVLSGATPTGSSTDILANDELPEPAEGGDSNLVAAVLQEPQVGFLLGETVAIPDFAWTYAVGTDDDRFVYGLCNPRLRPIDDFDALTPEEEPRPSIDPEDCATAEVTIETDGPAFELPPVVVDVGTYTKTVLLVDPDALPSPILTLDVAVAGVEASCEPATGTCTLELPATPGHTLTDTFSGTFTVSLAAAHATSTLSIEVDIQPPLAVDDAFDIIDGGTVDFLANDLPNHPDAPLDPATVVLDLPSIHGVEWVDLGNGTAMATVHTQPADPEVSFTYVVLDANGLSATATATATLLTLDGDLDGVSATDELLAGCDPTLEDTDGDGLTDGAELALGTNCASVDTDGDGLEDGDEVAEPCDPLLVDTDGDGLTDAEETLLPSDCQLLDTDGDGLDDGAEVTLGTTPSLADTDGDGISDGTEVTDGTDPLDPDDPAACPDDTFEPDDTLAEAMPAGSLYANESTVVTRQITGADQDWIWFESLAQSYFDVPYAICLSVEGLGLSANPISVGLYDRTSGALLAGGAASSMQVELECPNGGACDTTTHVPDLDLAVGVVGSGSPTECTEWTLSISTAPCPD